MGAPDWLTARPIAHRGLHGIDPRIVENSLGAVAAAIDRDFSVEVDLQLTADGGLVVFHDDTLARLTGRPERVRDLDLRTLAAVPYAVGGERIATFADLLALTGDRSVLVVELKSPGDRAGSEAMVRAVAAGLSGYTGRLALKSFDPDLVALLREAVPGVPRGILAGGEEEGPGRPPLIDRVVRSEILHAPRTRPDFISYHYTELPRPGVSILRNLFGLPVMVWTIRRPSDRDAALRHADQIVFEGFYP